MPARLAGARPAAGTLWRGALLTSLCMHAQHAHSKQAALVHGSLVYVHSRTYSGPEQSVPSCIIIMMQQLGFMLS